MCVHDNSIDPHAIWAIGVLLERHVRPTPEKGEIDPSTHKRENSNTGHNDQTETSTETAADTNGQTTNPVRICQRKPD